MRQGASTTDTAKSVREQLRRYQLLARTSSVINSSLEPAKVLDLVLREAVRVMHATTGSIVFIDPHTQLLEIEVAIGLSRKARQLKLAIGRGVTGWVAKTGKPLRVPDVTADPRYISVRKGIRSELAVPLLVENELIGVLNVDSVRKSAFSSSDEELLVALANQAARVIHHAWLYEAVARNARKLEALIAVGQSIISSHNLEEILQRVTRDACQIMGTKVCSLMLLNAARDRLELRACHGAGKAYLTRQPLSVADSLTGSVVRLRKPVRIYNVQDHDTFRHIELARQEGLVSMLSVPMVFRGQAIGALNVYTSQPYRFSNQDTKTLAALGNLAAIAIENARLHEKIVSAEEQLRHNERLGTIGLLAAEVAHEIRNPLTSMKMLFQSLDLSFPADDPRSRDAEIIADKMEHLNRICDQLRHFARSNEPAFEPVDINDLLDDVLLLTRHRLVRQSITLRTSFGESLPALRADRVQIEQVCLNLILNAADAMPTGGTLTVTTARDVAGGVMVTLADTGPGIPAEKQKELFQPFFTTRPKGTGLGLAIVQKIVEAHHGKITIESRPGKGTTIKLFLPV